MPVRVATTVVSMLTVPVAVIGLGTEVKPFPAVTEVTVPPPLGVAQVWSPRRKVVLFAVPDPNRAVPTVPVLIASAVIELVVESEMVLFVSVSVVARPTKVSVAVGKVSVPVLEIVEMTGAVKVLFVKVCVSVSPTMLPEGADLPPTCEALRFATWVVEATTNGAVPVATELLICPLALIAAIVVVPVKVLLERVCPPVRVTRPLLFSTVAEMLPVLIASPVIELDESRVLFDKVSVVARATRVSVAVGNVNVPVLDIVEITGVVSVLLVRVCVPVNVATVESIEIVPVEVKGPPVSPVPVLT